MGLDVTASKTTLLLGCQYPFRADVAIPDEPDDAPDAATPRARGTRVHSAIESGAAVPEDEMGYVEASQKWLESRGSPAIRKEIAFDWDGVISAEIGVGRKAYANRRASSIMTGTADVVFEDEIVDWKTSEHSAMHAHNQLRTLAVISGRHTVAAIELREDGTYGDHCRETLEEWDLDDHAADLLSAIASIPTAEPKLGSHCSEGYCPLRGTCPVYVECVDSAVAELVPAESIVRRRVTDPIVSEADAARAVIIMTMLEDWIGAKKDEAKAFAIAAGGSIRLDPKTVWKEVASKRGGLRGKEAFALAEKLGATSDELAALTYVTHFVAFKRVRSTQK